MIRQLTLLFTVCQIYLLNAQYYDQNWVMGYTNLVLRFDSTGFEIDSSTINNRNHYLIISSATVSKGTEIQFYTDGTKIYNRHGETMENGNKIFLSNTDLQIAGEDTFFGLTLVCNPVCLPYGNFPDSFLVIHKSVIDTISAHNIYFSVVDMKENAGLGKVVNTSTPLAKLMSGSNITACKHANGKDWWLVARMVNSNRYIKWLFKEDGQLFVTDTQAVGPKYSSPDFAVQNVFSFLGNKYITGSHYRTGIFDFDRCSGQLFFRDSITTPPDSFFNGTTGIQISKSGRYLYITRYNTLDQYDLSANFIDGSMFRLFDLRIHNAYRKVIYMQTTPNNSIFIAGYSSPIPYSIIHYPDSAGFACGLDTFVLPFNNTLSTSGMPTYPHYRTPAAEVWQAGAGASRAICDTAIAQGVQLGKPHIPGITYHWSSPHNTGFSSTQPQPVVYPTQTTTYILHLRDTVNTYYSCTERWDTVTVTIQKCIDTTAPPKPIQGISIFPNPFKSELTLQTDTDGVFELYNTLGQLILKTNLQGQQTQTISTAHMAAGVYHYRFTKTNSETKQGKVVKE